MTIPMEETAKEIRLQVLKMIYDAQTSHIGSNFSAIDILTVIFDRADFKKDKLIVSKGWVAASVYALAAHHGLIPKEDLEIYCKEGSRYIGLIEPLGFFGCEFAGGSMGLGLPAAVGFALAKKLKGEEGRVYVLMSDGEMQCGTTWESALIAAHHHLDNLIVIVDKNGWQAMGRTDDILGIDIPSDPKHRLSSNTLNSKWGDFRWDCHTVNGHNYREILDTLSVIFHTDYKQPICILANTIKGKGISFMENNNEWHYKAPSEEEYQLAMKELND